MGGMTIRFFKANPLMEMGEKSNGNGVEAIGVLSHLSVEIEVLGSGVKSRGLTGFPILTEILFSWFGNPSKSLRVMLLKM